MDFQQIRKYVKGVLTNSFLNKTTLDKLSTSNEGNLLFNGEEIKGGGGVVDELLNKAAYLAAEEEVTELPTATESSYHNYSTEETIVGKWIDGKPIYQKVFPFATNLTINTWINTPELINDKKQILQTFVIADDLCMPVIGNISKNSSNYVRIWSMRSIGNTITNVSIQYTKTTD